MLGLGMDITIPLCPHSRPAWHHCPKCPQPEAPKPLYAEIEQIEIPWEKQEEPEKSTVITFEFC